VRDPAALRNWTAFNYFQKGLTLVYAGQEIAALERPSLFEKDPVDWKAAGFVNADLVPLMKALYKIRKHPLFADSAYRVQALDGDVAFATHNAKIDYGHTAKPVPRLCGAFSLKGRQGTAKVPVPDGAYTDLISGGEFRVGDGRISLRGEPLIFEVKP